VITLAKVQRDLGSVWQILDSNETLEPFQIDSLKEIIKGIIDDVTTVSEETLENVRDLKMIVDVLTLSPIHRQETEWNLNPTSREK